MKLDRGFAVKVLNWCKRKYGKSRYNGSYPTISYTKPDYMLEDFSGYYEKDENHIYVNNVMCNTVEETVNTIIHEYTHYLQNMFHYQILAKYIDRTHHPMEIEAERIAKRDSKKCIEDLVRLYGSFDN